MALAIFAVAAVGSQQAFAGISPIVEFFETLSFSAGFATLEYDLINNSDFGVHQPPGPFAIFGFAVEVALDQGPVEWVTVTDVENDGPGRTDWCAGNDNECAGEGGVPLILAPDWDAGIVLTPLFGGLSTTDIGTFNSIFTNQDQVALFFTPTLTNMVGPGDSSDFNDFTISGPVVPSSDIIVIAIDENNQLINAITGEPFGPTPEVFSVSGEIISLQSTALLLSASQMTASWLVPVLISAVGIGLVLVRKK